MALPRRTPLTRSSAPPRRTGLRPRSKKTAAVYRDRRVPLVASILAERPYCEARLAVCTGRSCDVHEMKSRARGGSITDEDNLAALCRACHDWITTHPKEAEMLGWALPSWA